MGIPANLSEVPDLTPYVQYVATMGQTVYPYPFPITQDSDLIVVINGITQATDATYSVSGVGNDTGGNVTLNAGSAANDIVTLYRDIPIERLTQIAQNSGFSSSAFNAEFDNIYLILQQLEAAIGFCLQVPNTNNPAPTTVLTPALYANKYQAYDAYGNPTPAVLTSSGTITSALVLSLLTQAGVGQVIYPKNAFETSASITPSNYAYSDLPIFQAERYGFVGDGATNNDAAFTNVIALAVAAGGGILQLPPGNFHFNTLITFPANFTLRGCGISATTVRAANGNSGILIPNTAGRCAIENLGLYSTTSVTGVGLQVGDAVSQASIFKMKDCVVGNWSTGIRMAGALWTNFDNVEVTANTTGIDFNAGVSTNYCTTVSFDRCIITGNTGAGVKASYVPVYNESISFKDTTIQLNCESSTSTPEMCLSDGTNGVLVCVIDNCYFEGYSTAISQIDVKYMAYLRISGCFFGGSGNYAIHDSVGGTVYRALIHSNDIGARATASIYMTGETDVWEFNNGYASSSCTVTGTGCSTLPTGSGLASNPATNAAYGTTPTLTDGTHTASATTSASYSKVGNIVSFKLQIATSSLNSASGTVYIANGLPIASASGAEDTFTVSINGWTPASSEQYMTGIAAASGTTISLYGGGISSLTAIQAAALSATTTLYVSGTYQAAS